MHEYIASLYDVIFFRGNKSFHFGKWYSEGIFPPYPSTFQGFVRSKILDDHGLIGQNGRVAIENESETGKLVGDDSNLPMDISGPYLAKKKSPHGVDELFFSTPKDVIKPPQDKGVHRSACYRIDDCSKIESDFDFGLAALMNLPNEKSEKIAPPYIVSLREIEKYRISLTDLKLDEYMQNPEEARVGIGWKKDARSVDKGKFYVTPFNRLSEDFGFYFSIGQLSENQTNVFPKDGTQKLGSEAHLAKIERLKEEGKTFIEYRLERSRTELIRRIKETRTFRLVLLQPGIFEYGWLPFARSNGGGEEFRTCEIDGTAIKLQLLFAFTDAPLTISGYSFRKNVKTQNQEDVRIKKSVRAVPAGSVYLFELGEKCTDSDVEKLVWSLDNKKIKTDGPYSSMGFNHVILACGPELKHRNGRV